MTELTELSRMMRLTEMAGKSQRSQWAAEVSMAARLSTSLRMPFLPAQGGLRPMFGH